MTDYNDIYEEPEDIDPDTLKNLGPLARLAGIWQGNGGVDINPKADGPQRREFSERYELQPIDPQPNGPQLFYGLRYHTHINAPDEEITFHDQVGYWLWEPATGLIQQTIAIPRAQVVLASGYAEPGANKFTLTAKRGNTDYGICSTTFLEEAFCTNSFKIEVTFHDDGSWSYISDTELLIKGQTEPFLHRDVNRLSKVGEADLNPWLKIVNNS